MGLKHYWSQARVIADPWLLRRALRGLFRAAVLRKNTLRTIHVIPTLKCQAHCTMCSVAKLHMGGAAELTLAEYADIADQATRMGALAVTFTGGEPLLVDNLEELVRTFSGRHFYVSIVTNGLAMTRDRARKLKAAGLDSVHFRLDSLDEEENDWLRGFPGQCRRVKEAIELCLDEGLTVGLCAVIFPGHIARYERMAEFCGHRGLTLSLPTLAPVGAATGERVATKEDLDQLRDLLRRHRHAKVDWAFSYFLRPRCPAGKEKIALTCYGDVLGCTLNHIGFGNVREEPLEAIWKRAGRFSPFAKNAERCLAAFDTEYQQAYLMPLALAGTSPVRFDAHPNIRPASQPGLFAAAGDKGRGRLLPRLWPRVAVILIRLAQRLGPRVVKVRGRTFSVPRQVLNPKPYLTSEFMARHLGVRPGDEVLDMGTGSGVLAIVAAETARRVVAVDINPVAVECAEANVQGNGLEKVVRVVQSDLFAALPSDARFDTILFSPPYFDGVIRSLLDHALYDPQKALATRFFLHAGSYLKPGGHVQMVYSSAAQPELVLQAASRLGWDWTAVAEKKACFETLLIYRLTPSARNEDPPVAEEQRAGMDSPASGIGG